METLQTQRKTDMTGDGLRAWALVCLAAGAAGKCILQRKMLGLSGMTGQELLTLLETSDSAMVLVTVALVLQAVECCAVPIFAHLTAEGFRHTGSFGSYLRRVLLLAVVAEVPYDLAISGAPLSLKAQNPVFGVALALVVLYFWNRYPGRKPSAVAIKAAVLLAAMVWAKMLGISYGGTVTFLAAVSWSLREKQLMRDLAGAGAAICCCVVSPFFLVSPMSALVVRSYNGEPGQAGKWVRYLAYPTILLCLWAFTMVMP